MKTGNNGWNQPAAWIHKGNDTAFSNFKDSLFNASIWPNQYSSDNYINYRVYWKARWMKPSGPNYNHIGPSKVSENLS